MGGFKHTNVASGTARTHYATIGQIQDGTMNGGSTGGSANAYALTLSPAISAYVDKMAVRFRASFTNTGASTLNINGVGAKSFANLGGNQAFSGGEIVSGYDYLAVYNSGGSGFWTVIQIGPKLVYKDNTATSVISNTALATSLFTVNLPGSTLGSGNAIKFQAYGATTNSTGGNVNYTWRVNLNATILTFSAYTIISSGSAASWLIEGTISATDTAHITAVATLRYFQASEIQVIGSTASTLSGTLPLQITAQMGTASVNATVLLYGANVSLI